MNPETRAAGMVADLMVLSARTAPKGKGTDSISAIVKSGDELNSLADEMKRIGERDGMGFFSRDAENIRSADACVILGCAGGTTSDLNCGGCGYATCKEMTEAWRERAEPSILRAKLCHQDGRPGHCRWFRSKDCRHA